MNLNGKEYKSKVCKYCGTALGRDNNICPWCHRAQDEGADSEIDDMLHSNHSEKSEKAGSDTGLYANDIENEENIRKAHKFVGCLVGSIFLISFAPFILVILIIILNIAVNIFESVSGNTEQAEPETSYYEEYYDHPGKYSDEYAEESISYNEYENADSNEEISVINNDSSSSKVYDSSEEVLSDLYIDIALGHENLDDVHDVNEQGENYDTVFVDIVDTALSRIESRSYVESLMEGDYDPEYIDRAFNELAQYNTFGRLALAKALTILDEEDCSESLLREYLIDIYEFTEEDCEFAFAHINADFHQEALDYAKYLDDNGYSKDEVREELELYQFNENQIQYALDNIS